MSTLKMLEYSDFNPRSREGSDRFSVPSGRICMVISIHAPARGATDIFCIIRFGFIHFNPRSREGSDNIFDLIDLCADLFQSTLPRGERLAKRAVCYAIKKFQSTLPRGERLFSVPRGRICIVISLHAPARGATRYKQSVNRADRHFNPRSREGSDLPFDDPQYTSYNISIHAPARGATHA